MACGCILQWGDARSLYTHPASVEVAGFIGRGSVLPARVRGLDEDSRVLLRPEQLRVAEDGELQAELVDGGPGLVGSLLLGEGGLLGMDLPDGDWRVGQLLRLSIMDPEAMPRFPL